MRGAVAIGVSAGLLWGACAAALVPPRDTAPPGTTTSKLGSILAPVGAFPIAGDIKNPPPLLRAVLKDNVEDARRLIRDGASATAQYRGVYPYLLVAASLTRCDPRMVDLLLDNGANPDGVWITLQKGSRPPLDTYWSPLAAAAAGGSEACAETLLKHGAQPNVTNPQGITPLGSAVASSRCTPAMVKLLVIEGADPNFTPDLDDLPPRVVQHMLSAFGDISDARRLALARITNPIVKVPPLDLAVSYDHPACVRALINAGAAVNAAGLGGTILMSAVGIGRSPKITRLLLYSGADVNARDDHGRTALFAVITEGGPSPYQGPYCVRCAALLINAGADVNAVDKAGETPLLLAVSAKGALSIVKLLVAAKADVNYRDPKTGMTPLQAARAANRNQIILYLLSNGAGKAGHK